MDNNMEEFLVIRDENDYGIDLSRHFEPDRLYNVIVNDKHVETAPLKFLDDIVTEQKNFILKLYQESYVIYHTVSSEGMVISGRERHSPSPCHERVLCTIKLVMT